jgi:hypothetical protein
MAFGRGIYLYGELRAAVVGREASVAGVNGEDGIGKAYSGGEV